MKEEILAMRQTSISLKQILANYILIAPLLLLTWFLADLKPEGISSLAHLEKADKLFVDSKYSNAIEFYEKAADLGQITAIYKLGIINYEGLGVPINQIAGYRFFNECASKVYPDCQYMLGKMYVERQAGLSNVQKGLDLLYQAEKQNHASSSYYLYRLYRDGFEDISKNIDIAMEHLDKSSRLNYPSALSSMARHLLSGDGISKNELKAEQYIDAAARFEDPWAMKYLANQILSNNPGKHRLKRAFRLLDKLSKINNSGEPEFIKGKYILEFLEQDEQGWSLIDIAREKGWEAAKSYK